MPPFCYNPCIEQELSGSCDYQEYLMQLRKQYNSDYSKVVKVQALVRCYLAKQQYSRLRNATIKVQSIIRGTWARAAYRRLLAVIKVQALIRRYQIRYCCLCSIL